MKMCYQCESSEKRLHNEIEKRLRHDKILARKEVKLLLLGTGESGKSTFMKQMKIIHDNGFKRKELESQRKYVFHNTIFNMQTILNQMETLSIPLESTENRAHAERILTLNITFENASQVFPGDHLPAEFVESITCLWQDRGVQSCYNRRNEYHLSDSAGYFFSEVARYGEPGYLPNDRDMVRIRLPTTGIAEHCFLIKRIWLRIVDVGGQQNERRKWIHCFDCVKAIIFLTAMNEYDMYFEHDHRNHGMTRMQESLDLFKVISSIKILANASFILFLNKKDLFAEKIAKSPLKDFWPEYDGANEMIEGGNFIRQLFVTHAFGGAEQSMPSSTTANGASNGALSVRAARVEPRPIYAHFTCATDTKNIKFVFDSVKHAILQENIGEIFPDARF